MLNCSSSYFLRQGHLLNLKLLDLATLAGHQTPGILLLKLGIVAHMLVPETLRQFQVSLGYRVVARLSQGIE